MTEFHTLNLPWVEDGVKFEPEARMYWNDSLQRYEVWFKGELGAWCEDAAPNMQKWWNWAQCEFFGKSHEVGK